ncbi:MAG: ribonuclease R family protein [Acidobacteriota bacterium]
MSKSSRSKVRRGRVRGRVSVHPRGFGFLRVDVPDGEHSFEGPAPSIFLPPPDVNGILAGDLVDARLVEEGDGRYSATDLEILERPRDRLIGEVVGQGRRLRLRPDSEIANEDWPLYGAKGLSEGTTVVAEIEGSRAVRPRALEESEASLERVIARWSLRGEHTEELEERGRRARQKKIPRRDLRGVPTVTIDGPSTRDIDDAVAVLPVQADGSLRVLVSIADVDAFVPEGSELDLEARARGTSVYLPDLVLPMFPRSLSEDRCSLHPDVDRAALTVEMRIDPEGRIRAVDLEATRIRSDARLTYEQVEEFLDQGKTSAVPESVQPLLRWLRTAVGRLSAVRAGRGGLSMVREEATVGFDRKGQLSSIAARSETSAHRLIERLMVAANESVAHWLGERGLPALYRVHPAPDADGVDQLADFAANFGFETAFGSELTPRALAAFEAQYASARAAPAIRAVLRKSLGPARYTVHPGSHFGLAAPLYLHFTSPIRRYSDLVCHRIIKAHLRGDRDQVAVDPDLEDLAGHINELAFRAAKAEDQRLRMLAARYFSSRVGQKFDGNVISVKPFGLIVQLEGVGLTGAVPVESLPGSDWEEDRGTQSLVSKGGRRYGVGRAMRVRIAGTDEEQGHIELEPA